MDRLARGIQGVGQDIRDDLHVVFRDLNRQFRFHSPLISPDGLLLKNRHTPNANASLNKGEEVKTALGITHNEARVWVHPRLAENMSAAQVIEAIKLFSVGAHQDDALFLITRDLAKGALTRDVLPNVGVITMTNGVGSDRAEHYRTLPDKDMFLQRAMEDEMMAYNAGAALVVSIPYRSSEVKDRNFNDPVNNLRAILQACSSLDTVHTHNPIGDVHASHLAVAACVVAAARQSERKSPLQLFGGEVWGSLDGVAPKESLQSIVLTEREVKAVQALFRLYISQTGTKSYPEALAGRLTHLLTLAPGMSHVGDAAAAGVETPGGRYFFIDMTALLSGECSGHSIKAWVHKMRTEATQGQVNLLEQFDRT